MLRRGASKTSGDFAAAAIELSCAATDSDRPAGRSAAASKRIKGAPGSLICSNWTSRSFMLMVNEARPWFRCNADDEDPLPQIAKSTRVEAVCSALLVRAPNFPPELETRPDLVTFEEGYDHGDAAVFHPAQCAYAADAGAETKKGIASSLVSRRRGQRWPGNSSQRLWFRQWPLQRPPRSRLIGGCRYQAFGITPIK